MSNQKPSALNQWQSTVWIPFLLLAVVGCDGDPLSPCIDCGSSIRPGRYAQTQEKAFTVEEFTNVQVHTFTGNVTVRTGEPGKIRAVATLRVDHESDFDSIDLRMVAATRELQVRARNPYNLKNASVDFEVFAPLDAIPQVDAAVGQIDYQGSPHGTCRFTVGVGSIRLRLHPDTNVSVELFAAVGSINLQIPVDGSWQHPRRHVRGRIGSGDEGSLHASTAVGSIYLMSSATQ